MTEKDVSLVLDPEEWLSARQAAAELGVSKAIVNRLTRRGTLPSRKVGPVLAIRRGDLDAVRDRPRPGRPRRRV